jgi:hypothetical protein
MNKIVIGVLLVVILGGCTSLKEKYKIGACYAIPKAGTVGIIVQVNEHEVILKETNSTAYISFHGYGLYKVPDYFCEGIK